MIKQELLGSTVEIDFESTREWYSRGKEWGCECAHCCNFLELAKKKQLPQQIIELMESFGIRLEQATYVCQLYDDDKGHYYQFSYRIAGNLVKEANADAAFFAEHIGHCCHETYPYGASDFPEPHFDIEFFLTLPWVINDVNK